jgi:ubiquinone biosynthesis protein
MPRAVRIALRLLGLAWVLWRTRLTSPATGAQALRATLADLGTTFVKLGQGLSLRRDVVPSPYREALETLQDHVPPFPVATARAMIEHAFGQPVSVLFARFEDTPLAAASVAQVHRATLPTGVEVIVKVRRPGIRALVDHDVRWLRRLVRVAQVLVPAVARVRPLALIDELSEQLRQEIDMRVEARNARRLIDACRAVPDIKMPLVIEPYVHEEVIVQEYSHGKGIATVFGTPEGQRLARVLLDTYLHQLFVVGFFHGDPHPGNLFAMPEGPLCFHDFGLVGFLDARSRRALAAFLVAVVQRDAEAALDAGIELQLLGGALDRREFTASIDQILSELAGLPLKDWSIAEALLRVARLGHGQHFTLPRDLLVLMRALFLLESTTRALDPQFDLVGELMARRDTLEAAVLPAGPALTPRTAVRAARDVPALLARWLREAQREGGRPSLSMHHRGLEELEETVARTGNRLALALVTLGLYLAGSLLMLHSAGPRWNDVPVFAIVAYAFALGLSVRLVRAITRSGRL